MCEEESSRYVYILGFCGNSDLGACLAQLAVVHTPYERAAEPSFLYRHNTCTMEAVITLKRKRMTEAEWGAAVAQKVPILRVQMIFLLQPASSETMACVNRIMQYGANTGMCDMYRVLSGGRMSEHDRREWVMKPGPMAALRREASVITSQLFLKEHQHYQSLQTLELATANLDMVTELRNAGHMFNVGMFESEVARLELECISLGTEATDLKHKHAKLIKVYDKQKVLRKRQHEEAKLRRQAMELELINKLEQQRRDQEHTCAPAPEPDYQPDAKRVRSA